MTDQTMQKKTGKRYSVARMDEVEPRPCPCGQARRAFVDEPGNNAASLHITTISGQAQLHYHKKMTELYFVLEGEGKMELDGDMIALQPNTAILIKPGCRHRAIGTFRMLIVPMPPFDENDEWFD